VAGDGRHIVCNFLRAVKRKRAEAANSPSDY
jgi:hypothetical protein